jgi:hypothetical protein
MFSVSAKPLDITFQREIYAARETVQAEIKLNVELEENIKATDIRLLNSTFGRIDYVSPFIVQFTDDYYYLYFNLPRLEEGNYTFQVLNLIYKKSGTYVKENQTETLTIENTSDRPIITISPGAIKVTDLETRDTFKFFIDNIENKEVNINLSKTLDFIFLSDDTLKLGPNEKAPFNVYFQNTDGYEHIILDYTNGSYDILVWFEDSKPYENETNVTLNETIETDCIRFVSPENSVNFTIDQNNTISGYLRFRNFCNSPIYNINFNLTGNLKNIIKLNITNLEEIQPGDTLYQGLDINPRLRADLGIYSGNLTLESNEIFDYFPIYITIKDPEEEINITDLPIINETENDTIENETEPEEEKTGGKTGIWILLIILIIIIIVILFVYLKIKNPPTSSFPLPEKK